MSAMSDWKLAVWIVLALGTLGCGDEEAQSESQSEATSSAKRWIEENGPLWNNRYRGCANEKNFHFVKFGKGKSKPGVYGDRSI